ncbi:MAG: hypothetical protein ABIL68_04730 [bacterium]
MSSQYETGKEKIVSLSSWYQEHSGKRNEATTRLHIIDTLLFECLYWDKRTDCMVEERLNGKYSDYTLMCPRRTVIVEAKREGLYFEIPSGYSNRRYRIKTLIKDVEELGAAILQASDYCQKRGAPFGVVTNGHQLAAFIGSRQDGLAPDEGDAFVFESFEALCKDFHLLWDLLSKPGVISRKLQKHLLESDQSILPRKLSETISHFPGIKNRNVLQTDLQILADFVIEDIVAAQQLEDEFLEYCYCKSGALSQYALNGHMQNERAPLFMSFCLVRSLMQKSVSLIF